MPLPSGLADVWLHVNIHETVDEDGNQLWEADENYFRTNKNLKYIEDHFDELINYAQPDVGPVPSTEDLLLEMAANHEMRLCLLELGV